MMRMRTLIIPAVIAATVAVAGGAARKHVRHAHAPAARELALDVDGDGKPETVRLSRVGDEAWADVFTNGEMRSTTRLGTWSGDESLAALDVDGDGKPELVRYFSDSDGDHAQLLVADGAAFAEAWTGLIASNPRLAAR